MRINQSNKPFYNDGISFFKWNKYMSYCKVIEGLYLITKFLVSNCNTTKNIRDRECKPRKIYNHAINV